MATEEVLEEAGAPESALGMSDEDFLNSEEPENLEAEPEQPDEEQDVEDNEPAPENDDLTEEPTDGLQDQTQEEAYTGTQEEEVDETPDQAASEDQEGGSQEESEEASNEESTTIDYEAEYNRLLAPFKANGRQMQVSSVDDALTLMQMGANYNKKMAGLKPNLRMLKMLDNNDLLHEDKINRLIDISKRKPEAIAQLLKDSGIDPLDIDTNSEEEYKPETYTVNDQDVELDLALDDIRDTAQFKDTMSIIGNKLDQKSRQYLYEKPSEIKIINDHIGSGLYGQLMNIVENERSLGRLQDMSDLDAYKHVGSVIQANGGFNQPPIQQGQAGAQLMPNEQQRPAQKAVKRDPKLKSRKRAAGSPKGSPGSAPQEFNPLSMSDEEFEKATANLLM